MSKYNVVSDFASIGSGSYWYNTTSGELVSIPPHMSNTMSLMEDPEYFGLARSDLPEICKDTRYDQDVLFPALRNGLVSVVLQGNQTTINHVKVEAGSEENLRAALGKLLDEHVFDTINPFFVNTIIRTGTGFLDTKGTPFRSMKQLKVFLADTDPVNPNDSFLPARLLNEGKPFMIVSAYQSGLSEGENQTNHENLRTMIETEGFAYVELDNAYDGVSYKSFLVYSESPDDVNILAEKALEWGKTFNQNEIGMSNGGQLMFFDPQTREGDNIVHKKVSYNTNAFNEKNGHSTLDGTQFVFV